MINRIKNWIKNFHITVWEVGIKCNDEDISCAEYYFTYKAAHKHMKVWNETNKDKEYSAFLGGVELYFW